MCMCVYTQCTYGRKRKNYRSLFFPSTIWVRDIEHWLSGLVGRALTHGAILSIHMEQFKIVTPVAKYLSKFPSLYSLTAFFSNTDSLPLHTWERWRQPSFPISVDLLQKPPLPLLSPLPLFSVPSHPALLPTLAPASGLPLYQLSWISLWPFPQMLGFGCRLCPKGPCVGGLVFSVLMWEVAGTF